MEKTWRVMKEIIGKMHQHDKRKLPRKCFVEKNYITLETEIAKKFNIFFIEVGPPLATKVPTPLFRKKTAPPYLKDVLP